VIGKRVSRVLVVFRRLQERLGRNAADIGAGPAGRGFAIAGLPIVDARGLEAELCGTDRGGISTGSGTDDNDVERLGHASGRF